jgi:hypothetical protein
VSSGLNGLKTRMNPLRVRYVTKGAGRFVQANVPVIIGIRFKTETS